MSDMSITSILFFASSGICFMISFFFVIAAHKKKEKCMPEKEKLNIIDEVIMIHTDEKIE